MKSISLSGRLGHNTEVKHVGENDTPICEFDIAVEHYDRQQKERVAEWYRIVCFGKQAEFMGEYPDKGDAVVVTGEPVIEKYTSKKYTSDEGDGAPMQRLKVVAPPGGVDVYYKGEVQQRGSGDANPGTPEPQQTDINDLDDDDIPF